MSSKTNTTVETFDVQRRILGAVLLQDMRTRFGRSYLSYLVAIAWPLFHAIGITGAYLLMTSFAPVGDDPAVFMATGILPYILCLYPARQLGNAVIQNRQLLNLPILRPIHVITARLLLEIITGMVVCLIYLAALASIGVEIWPIEPATAAAALCATLYLAVGLGFLNVIIVGIFGPMAIVAFILVMLLLYLSSGITLPIPMMPEPVRSLTLLCNPLAALVEWMRSAYYASYDADVVNKGLVVGTASVALLLGLLGERFMRNKLLT